MLEGGASILWSEKVKDELVLDGNDIELREILFHVQLPSSTRLHSCIIYPCIRKTCCLLPAFAENPICGLVYRNSMSRTKLSENSETVSTLARRDLLLMRVELVVRLKNQC